MNATAVNIADGDVVALTCSLKYRASIQLNAHVTVVHPGAQEIDRDTQRNTNEIRSVVSVKVESLKNTEDATSFGPLQCNVQFGHRRDDVAVFSVKPVKFASSTTDKYPILSE